MDLRAAAYKIFCGVWRDLVPFITVMKPMTDLCHDCQKNSTAIMRAANSTEEAKSAVSHSNTTVTVLTLSPLTGGKEG